jgi:hypothetical protein
MTHAERSGIKSASVVAGARVNALMRVVKTILTVVRREITLSRVCRDMEVNGGFLDIAQDLLRRFG